MENIEIIFEDVSKEYIDELWAGFVDSNNENIIRGNLFSGENVYDISSLRKSALSEIFSSQGGGYIVLSKVRIGIQIGEAVISFSFDEDLGNVEFNFHQIIRESLTRKKIKENALVLFNAIQELKQKSSAKKVYFGFEPAKDDNMCMISLPNNLSSEEIANIIGSTLYVQ